MNTAPSSVSIRFNASFRIAREWAKAQGMTIQCGVEAVWRGVPSQVPGMLALGITMGLTVECVMDAATGADLTNSYTG